MNKYNIGKFNIAGVESQEPKITMQCAERVEANILSYSNIMFEMFGFEKIDSSSILSGGISTNFNLQETIGQNLNILSICVLTNLFVEDVTSISQVSENIFLNPVLEEKTNVVGYASENIKFSESFRNKISLPFAFIGKDISISPITNYEDVWINSKSAVLNTNISKIDINLPPDSILKINSKDFTVKIDDKNALNHYTGEWINISRNSEKIIITSSNRARLKGKIIYRECFL